MALKNIHAWFVKNKGLHISKSTISTWYNPVNIIKIAQLGDVDINNNDTCVNPKQRPRIYWDIEAIMKIHIIRSQLQGIPMTKEGVRLCAIKLYERLKSLTLYDNTGTRTKNEEFFSQ